MDSILQPRHFLVVTLAGRSDHRRLRNRLINPGDEVGRRSGDIKCRERIGGLLRYYNRNAA